MLAQGEHIVAIPGTTRIEHLDEDLTAEDVVLDAATLAELDALINHDTVHGPRYTAGQQAGVDTETFPDEAA